MHGLSKLNVTTILVSGFRVTVTAFFQRFVVAGLAGCIRPLMKLMVERNRIHLPGHFFRIHGLIRHPAGKEGDIGLVPFHPGNRCHYFNRCLCLSAVAPGTIGGTGLLQLTHQCLMTIDTGIVRCRADG